MAGKTTALSNDVLKVVTGQPSSILSTTPLAGVYVGLFTAAPTDAGGGTEASTAGTAYARVNSKTKWAAPSNGSVVTNADLVFPTATADWGTLTHFAIFDAATAGNMLYWGPLAASKVVGAADTFTILAGNLTITED